MFAIIDTETTGGSPNTSRITEIAILIHNGERVIEEYSTLVNPGMEIPPFVVALTGISNEMVAVAPAFEEVADKIFTLTEGKIFVAHDVKFDYTMIRNEFNHQK